MPASVPAPVGVVPLHRRGLGRARVSGQLQLASRARLCGPAGLAASVEASSGGRRAPNPNPGERWQRWWQRRRSWRWQQQQPGARAAAGARAALAPRDHALPALQAAGAAGRGSRRRARSTRRRPGRREFGGKHRARQGSDGVCEPRAV